MIGVPVSTTIAVALAAFGIALAVLQAIAYKQRLAFMLGFVALSPLVAALLFASIGRSVSLRVRHGVHPSPEWVAQANARFVAHLRDGACASGVAGVAALFAAWLARQRRGREDQPGT